MRISDWSSDVCSSDLGRSTDDADHLIKICDGDDKAKQEMRPITRLVQFELGAARDDLFAELDESVDDVAQVEQFGPSAANGEHIGLEARLSGRVPPMLVEHPVWSGVALQVDDKARKSTSLN